jgi:hypothetical protein
MLTLGPGYARLDLGRDEDFTRVTESVRTILHVCRLNGFPGALISSHQDAFDWRSSLRIALRFAAARGAFAGLRLALVTDHFNDGARDDVLVVAREAQLDCRVFREEAEALAWLSGAATGPAAPPQAAPRR